MYLSVILRSLEVDMSEWISIDDRMPVKFQKVIVADIGHGEIYSFTGARYMGDGFFVAETDGLEAKNYDGGASISLDMDATHWMPLPKPPVE